LRSLRPTRSTKVGSNVVSFPPLSISGITRSLHIFVSLRSRFRGVDELSGFSA
jgi:hypothetical protein